MAKKEIQYCGACEHEGTGFKKFNEQPYCEECWENGFADWNEYGSSTSQRLATTKALTDVLRRLKRIEAKLK